MNKTILCLINGLGVEHKDSYNIYSKKVMPNFDKCVNYELFSTLSTSAYDYATGYQILNTGNTNILSVSFLDKVYNENTWNSAPNYQDLLSTLQNDNKKIHVFCSIYNKNTFDHLKSLIQSLKNNKKIIIHLMLNDQTMDGYKVANKFIERFRYEIIPNSEIGMIFGNNVMSGRNGNDFNDLWTMYIKGIGEQWNEPNKKFSIYEQQGVLPCDAKVFYVSGNFKIEENTDIIFFNYDQEDFSKLYNLLSNPQTGYNSVVSINNLTYYSIFPLTNIQGIKSLYENLTSETSLAKGLEQLSTKSLVLVDKNNLNTVCFMNNGLTKNNSQNIVYMLTDGGLLYNDEQMKAIIDNEQYPLIIINYSIDQYVDEASLKNALTQIDNSLSNIIETCKNKYRLIISSLYGIEKQIKLENGNDAKVSFKNNVPCVLIDNKIDKSKFKLQTYESISKLLPTLFKSLKPDVKVNSLLVSKSLLHKIFYK